ncbi:MULTISPECIES: YqhV family protein [unclassified Bacillus (in: firmicutes)]|uniref:YqhV family protein n=1 Tax=unclassified Bacillus (in: firmicutes) TaxID=185979 RepID=UPI001BE9EAE5|nr:MULTISPECIES: YqhV family protein [unclassified Bacillus (in: firmicutes)]MBT2637869.1 YqhV family protein [Bacillus sp. ISL-39]MBT2661041.1 YqhV family protein [Bacillus sp. ISL-45]
MFHLFEKAVLGMAFLRFFSGSFEILVAAIILKYNDVEKALIVNSTLAFVGPVILIATTTIGLVGLAEKISFQKIILIFCGLACILYGVKSN